MLLLALHTFFFPALHRALLLYHVRAAAGRKEEKEGRREGGGKKEGRQQANIKRRPPIPSPTPHRATAREIQQGAGYKLTPDGACKEGPKQPDIGKAARAIERESINHPNITYHRYLC